MTVENGIDGRIPVAIVPSTKHDYMHSIMIETQAYYFFLNTTDVDLVRDVL